MSGDFTPKTVPTTLPRVTRPTLTRNAWRAILTGRSSRPEEACDNKILPPTPEYTPPAPGHPRGRFVWGKRGWVFVPDAPEEP